MRKVLLWVVAGLVAAAGLALVVWLAVRGKKSEANRAMADVIDTWTEPRILIARQKAEALTRQFGEESAQAASAAVAVQAIETELKTKYTELELTPEEMETRLRALRV